ASIAATFTTAPMRVNSKKISPCGEVPPARLTAFSRRQMASQSLVAVHHHANCADSRAISRPLLKENGREVCGWRRPREITTLLDRIDAKS
ncbi:MAG: hypothetical protein HY056_17100, partial [Proteobacteria bacterium]|nr:hypothetical protein [Pseudomonadota bacterium]